MGGCTQAGIFIMQWQGRPCRLLISSRQIHTGSGQPVWINLGNKSPGAWPGRSSWFPWKARLLSLKCNGCSRWQLQLENSTEGQMSELPPPPSPNSIFVAVLASICRAVYKFVLHCVYLMSQLEMKGDIHTCIKNICCSFSKALAISEFAKKDIAFV